MLATNFGIFYELESLKFEQQLNLLIKSCGSNLCLLTTTVEELPIKRFDFFFRFTPEMRKLEI